MSIKKKEMYRHLAHKAQSCLNMKVLEKVIESSVKDIVRIDYRQFSFMAGRKHNGCSNFRSSSTARGILCQKYLSLHEALPSAHGPGKVMAEN